MSAQPDSLLELHLRIFSETTPELLGIKCVLPKRLERLFNVNVLKMLRAGLQTSHLCNYLEVTQILSFSLHMNRPIAEKMAIV
jgi:hypothetical protein